ncbi:hypothetical protein PV326_011361, partial [Microctonus aethiopoides]
GKQVHVQGATGSAGSKCSCCPYGYHIDLDFVKYCEAVAAGSADKNTIDRRKKRERRRQCQSMEILLGLVSPPVNNIQNDPLQELNNSSIVNKNGLTKLDDANNTMTSKNYQYSEALDLSDVVGDFEATLKRLTKSSTKNENKKKHCKIGNSYCC